MNRQKDQLRQSRVQPAQAALKLKKERKHPNGKARGGVRPLLRRVRPKRLLLMAGRHKSVVVGVTQAIMNPPQKAWAIMFPIS